MPIDGLTHDQLANLAFTTCPSNPVLTAADVDWRDADVADPTEVSGIDVVPTAPFPDPRASFHAYFAAHETDGVGLARFDDPFGEWTVRDGPVIDSPHGGEPGAFWDRTAGSPEDGADGADGGGELKLYSNRPNRQLHLFSSPDGESFTEEATVLDTADYHAGDEGHWGYPSALRTRRGVYLAGWQKIAEGRIQPTVKFSPDGRSDWVWWPAVPDPASQPTGTRPGDGHYSALTFFPLRAGGPYLAFYSLVNADGTRDVRLGITRDGRSIGDLGVAVAGAAVGSWATGRVSAPAPFWIDDGTLGLAFNGGADSASRSVGVARADLSEVA